jgi:5-methylcytosine-specific restriction endonuclease McrA
MQSKRTKALAIDRLVRYKVMERDNNACIVCGNRRSLTLAHYVNRGAGGLGIEQNLVVLCFKHHHEADQTIKRKSYLGFIKGYLKEKYKDWNEEVLSYGHNQRDVGQDQNVVGGDNEVKREG